jgi:hypothetical protein
MIFFIGPYSVSPNHLQLDWYSWAPLAASEGWLVLEPNYRGSTGYGDQFLREIRYRPLSLRVPPPLFFDHVWFSKRIQLIALKFLPQIEHLK